MNTNDELRALWKSAVARENEANKNWSNEARKWIAERDALRAEVDLFHESVANLADISVALHTQNAHLRAALRQIGQAVDPEADQLQNWIAGQVDAALGDTPAKPDVNAAVVVS